LSNQDALLEVTDLKKYFPVRIGLFNCKQSYLKAAGGISFQIKQGETFGLVGELGCGKSTTGRTILRLYNPTDGHILFDGEELAKVLEKDLKRYRKRIQTIFQDPYASLNARMTITDFVGDGIRIHELASGRERQE
jgi:oligopeptide transport system ATP-binding protein